jgi:HK97 family phage prohead protease
MENRETKSFRAEVKAAGATEGVKAGEFIAVVSVFNNIDLGGDRIQPGAFASAIEQMKANGDVLPIIWSHDWDNPEAHIGYASPDDIIETDEGLQLKGVLDIDRPFAEQVHHLMVSRRVKEFSFGYFVNDSEIVTDADGTKVRELKDIDIFEAGPTLKGMNPATRLLQAASALKASPDEVRVGAYASWDSSGGTSQGRIEHVMTEGTLGVPDTEFALDATEADPAVLLRVFQETADGWEATEVMVGHRASELRMIEPLKSGAKALEAKAVSVPEYVAENAARGLAYYEDGLGGDGLVPATIADAREMAGGNVSDSKLRRIAPWIARHLVDFDAPSNSDDGDAGYPGPGLVAHLLWGSGPDRAGALRTQEWAEAEVARLDGKSATEDADTASIDTQTPEAQASGDNTGTIDTERLLLLVRPRNKE